MVYLFAVHPVQATALSLFIVGLTSAVGAVNYFKQNWVDIKTTIVFGIPSIIAVYLTRKWIVPFIPDKILEIGGFELTKSLFLMLLFAVLMILASYSMIKPAKKNNQNTSNKELSSALKNFLPFLEGSVVGVLTGLVGAGGGFLIIPALVVVAGLEMKVAIGSSLVIIALKSLLGFLGEDLRSVPWAFLSVISGFSILGIFMGTYLSKKIDGNKLKPAFGYFVLMMGIFIIVKEVFFK
ncbi:MAG: UPF0721 transmembrane protein [Bacteroidia bacterium]|nr:MAG: UPF0721 transmembrane protein [Bacteroidia bacterium]